MNPVKLLLATIAGTVAIIVVDSFWFLIVMKNFYSGDIPKYENEIEWMHLFGELALGFLISLLYPMFKKSGSNLQSGARIGFLIGLVAMAPAGGHMIAEMGGNFQLPLMLLIDSVLSGMAGGIVVASIFKEKE